jgi:hypothetical protein
MASFICIENLVFFLYIYIFVYLNSKNNELAMISPEEAAQQLGIELHSICFSAIYYTPQTVLQWEKIAEILKEEIDPNLNIKPVYLLCLY